MVEVCRSANLLAKTYEKYMNIPIFMGSISPWRRPDFFSHAPRQGFGSSVPVPGRKPRASAIATSNELNNG
jgi:hypothetical protein